MAFDLAVPGYSWVEHLASRGYRVFRWDPSGYGDSDDPAALDEPPSSNHPVSRTVVVEPQAERVADDVAERTGDDALHVICWSAGCSPALAFAAARPERVQSLVLYAATFGPLSGLGLTPFDPETAITNFVGAYRLTSADDVAVRWDDMIPVDDKTAYRDPEVLDTWVRDFLASDATSSQRNPVSVRVPNGMLADSYDVLLGHPPYDAARVVAPALVIRGVDDPETNTRGQNLLLEALGSTDKQAVEVSEGTHYITVERSHEAFWEVIDGFLDDHG
ncbi:MAG: alpha/beta hydrolase [Deltaproteobacteria bacterium]|nr:alpha/beta hydrolase [Deltaproteobacteria bacterium]